MRVVLFLPYLSIQLKCILSLETDLDICKHCYTFVVLRISNIDNYKHKAQIPKPMSARDLFHEAVKKALQKEQWVITDDPLKFKFGDVNFQVDLGAEKIVAAERLGEKIAVEIKSFLNPSAITDFYSAMGQFLSYRLAIEANEPSRTLYLAVPLDVYQTFFQLEFTQTAVQRYQILLVVYNPVNEEIVKWIK